MERMSLCGWCAALALAGILGCDNDTTNVHFSDGDRETTEETEAAEATDTETQEAADQEDTENPDPCAAVLALACGDRFHHDTTIQGRENLWFGYGCSARGEGGPESIYAVNAPDGATVTLTLSGLEADLDLFLLTACDPFSCMQFSATPGDIQDDEVVVFTAQPGVSYLLVVDGYDRSQGGYDLAMDCQ